MSVSITEQLRCAMRELTMRHRVYKDWVERGRMTQAKADAEIAAMQAIVETLTRLEQAERLF